jgi:hypothetical protein
LQLLLHSSQTFQPRGEYMRLTSTVRLGFLLFLVFMLMGTGLQLAAQATPKTYVIMAPGQGKGSTAFAANLGPSLVANYEAIGVVIAQSADPKFATWAAAQPGAQSVTEDFAVQWISPNEMAVDSGTAIDDVAASALPQANHESFSPNQWNLHQIHADQTADNGDRGNGVVRARVAVLDSGIITDHIDIAANLNLGLS